MADNRDNFNLKIIDKLRSRVGNKCSNPSCRKYTIGPKEDEGVLNIGIAAHICAAAPGGPRYDVTMSSNERKAFSNGIWLCANCATLIDRDWRIYPISLLKRWKKEAEAEARNNIGEKAATKQDSIDLMTMALSGYPKKYLPNAIENIHAATSQSLAELDPRFSVMTTFDGKKTGLTIHPTQSVNLILSLKKPEINNSEINKLINFGDAIELQSDDVVISGSPLIERLFSDTIGKIIFSPPAIPALLKVSFFHKDTGVVEALDDIHGMLAYGREMFSFNGSCYEGLLGLTMKIPAQGSVGTINTRLDLDKWNGIDVVNLPYFSKLHAFFSKCTKEYPVNFKLEVKGEQVREVDVNNFNSVTFFSKIFDFLEYTQLVRAITSKIRAKIKFTQGVRVSSLELKNIKRIVKRLDGGRVVDTSMIQSNMKAIITLTEDGKKFFRQMMGKPTSIRMTANESEVITLFGQSIQLPKENHEFHNILMVSDSNIDDLNIGDQFEIEGVPGPDFKYIEKYHV